MTFFDVTPCAMVGPVYAKTWLQMNITNQMTGADGKSAKRDMLTRRGFLGVGATALAAAGMAPVLAADRSTSDPGPGNPALDAQNPDSMWPPGTDSKSLVPTFKYPFSFANKRAYPTPRRNWSWRT
jgi:hypothetical protein